MRGNLIPKGIVDCQSVLMGRKFGELILGTPIFVPNDEHTHCDQTAEKHNAEQSRPANNAQPHG
jgi:hypothetical protein